jgi:hypothetical protein
MSEKGDVFMLKTAFKRYIIDKIIYIIMLFSAFCAAPAIAADQQPVDEFEIKPVYEFSYKAGRDPFEPRYKNNSIKINDLIDISALYLMGITVSGGGKAALFSFKNGSNFGYVFMDGKLYGENNTVIEDIKGEINENSEVILIQGDREILFKLHEEDKVHDLYTGETKYDEAGTWGFKVYKEVKE